MKSGRGADAADLPTCGGDGRQARGGAKEYQPSPVHFQAQRRVSL